ncbi:MAG: hypothetical protein ACAH82_01290 [Solirubrobacteraceae bacterium]
MTLHAPPFTATINHFVCHSSRTGAGALQQIPLPIARTTAEERVSRGDPR